MRGEVGWVWGGGICGSFWKKEKSQQIPEGEKERAGRREGSPTGGRGSVFAKACR